MANVADSSTRVVDGCQIEFWPRTTSRPTRRRGRRPLQPHVVVQAGRIVLVHDEARLLRRWLRRSRRGLGRNPEIALRLVFRESLLQRRPILANPPPLGRPGGRSLPLLTSTGHVCMFSTRPSPRNLRVRSTWERLVSRRAPRGCRAPRERSRSRGRHGPGAPGRWPGRPVPRSGLSAGAPRASPPGSTS